MRRYVSRNPVPFSCLLMMVGSVHWFACGDNDITDIQDGDMSDVRYDAGPTCGNGLIDPEESCDGSNFGAVDCQILGHDEGVLICTAGCQLDDSGCFTCGNGIAEAAEACDGTDVQGQDCTDHGFVSGILACDQDCQLDLQGCTNAVAVCGNGIAEANEVCDGSDLRGQDCLDLGHAGGELACNLDCTFDPSDCWTTPPICGNGVVEPGEDCDDGDGDNADDCPDGVGGTCMWAQCGDGFVWAGQEECDDGNWSTADDCPDGPAGTCVWYFCGDGFVHSNDENCDTLNNTLCHSGCLSYCGDGSWQSNYEACDDGNNIDDLACSADCQHWCGDGVVDAFLGEQCDEGFGWDPYNPSGEGPGCLQNCVASVCGDGVCDEPVAETASTCSDDCGCNALWWTGPCDASGGRCFLIPDATGYHTECLPLATTIPCGTQSCGLASFCYEPTSTCHNICNPDIPGSCGAGQVCSQFTVVNGIAYGACP
ncbi:DUF4215 domain-containing protein [Myxococcota bacterium]